MIPRPRPATPLVTEVFGHLRLQPGLEDPADQPGQHTTRAGQVHPLRPGLRDQLLGNVAEIRQKLAPPRRQT